MLKIAYAYKDKLQIVYLDNILKDKYKYYNNGNYYNYDISNIAKNSWDALEFVSIDKNDNILGFLKADINRATNNILNLGVVNFSEHKSIIFSKDFYVFLIDLFIKYNFRKINFNVVIGNPIERMYDKYINKYGGRIVGIYKDETKLVDGTYCDSKVYEIFKSDFEKNYKSHIKNKGV